MKSRLFSFTDNLPAFNEKTMPDCFVSDKFKPQIRTYLKLKSMKTKSSIFTSFIFLSLFFTSCIYSGPSIRGNGNVAKETRHVKEFDEIEVSRGMNVYISQGEITKVEVNADENLLDAIETVVVGDVLEIRAIKNIRSATTKKVLVTVPKITAVKTSSGSNAYSETLFDTKTIEFSTSSGSNIKFEVHAERINASTSSGSNITIHGKTGSFSGKASSGSNIFAEELAAKNCEAKASSGSNIWITVENSFTGIASSGANVFYFGDPGSTDIEKSSGGNVMKK